jgi:hypothetical protein
MHTSAQHCRALALKMRIMEHVTAAAIAHLSRLPALRWSLVDAYCCRDDVQAALRAKRHWSGRLGCRPVRELAAHLEKFM